MWYRCCSNVINQNSMKNILFSLLFLPLFSLAQKGFVVTGNVTGLPEGAEVKIATVNEGGTVVASAPVKGGAFTVTGSVPEPGLYWLVLGSEQPQHIYLENNTIKVSGSKSDIKNIKIEGSASHADFDQFRKIFNPLVGELNAAAAGAGKATDEKKHAQLMKQYDSIGRLIQVEVDNYIANRKASYVSPFLLLVTAQLNDDIPRLESRFNLLDSSVRQSGIGKNLAEFIAFNKVGSVGTEAMEFTQNDPSGKPVSLSSFRGKYVLIDFWASWCKPCREENPNVVKAYKKFNNKNFTVLGVSLDRDKEPWIKAIERDNLTWTQVSDLQFWNNSVAQLYHVQGIPQNFLVDPNGKIVGRNLRGEELEAKLCELLGCK